MDFLLDELLSHRLIAFIERAGHTAESIDLLGMKSVGDEEVLWLAKQRGWVTVTVNAKDYQLLHRTFRRWDITDAHAGILLIPDQLVFVEVARILDIFASQNLPTTNGVYEWLGDEEGSWVRYDPPRWVEMSTGSP